MDSDQLAAALNSVLDLFDTMPNQKLLNSERLGFAARSSQASLYGAIAWVFPTDYIHELPWTRSERIFSYSLMQCGAGPWRHPTNKEYSSSTYSAACRLIPRPLRT